MENGGTAGTGNEHDVVVTALRTVLGVDEAPDGTTFGALGGDSMRAVRVLSRLWRELGVELPVDSLTKDTTVAGFVAVVSLHTGTGPA
jgi:acyl carrier protein